MCEGCQLQGKALTATARGIHAEFAAAADALSKVQYDPLDLKATQFDADYRAFGKTVSELERRTSAIISQVTFGDQHSFMSVSLVLQHRACG